MCATNRRVAACSEVDRLKVFVYSNYRGPLSLIMTHLHGQVERHRLGLSGDDSVVGVDQLNPNLVRADRQTGDVDCVVVARVRPPPRQVVDV